MVKPVSKRSARSRIEHLLHISWALPAQRNAAYGVQLDEALALAGHLGDQNYSGLVLLEKALFECLVKNNYYQSIQLCDEAFAMLKGDFRHRYEPYYHLNLGRNYHFTGDNVLSQKHYLQCIKALESKINLDIFEKRWLAHAYYNIFTLFNYMGAELAQHEHLNKALALYEQLGDKGGIGNCYNSYAVYYFKSDRNLLALEWLSKAYELAESERSIPLLSIYSANLGLVYTRLKEFDKGLFYFGLAEEYDAQLNNMYHTAHTSHQMGEAYNLMGRYDEAIACFRQAEMNFEIMGVKRSLSIMYDNISESFALKGDHKNAFVYKKKYADSLKYVFDDEKTFAIAKARNDFELEKKEKEAQLLKKKNAQIEKYARQLEISNNELRQFAHVTSHDLREPLRMVTSYVGMLKKHMNGKLSEEELEYMHYITEGTGRMHNLIRDLLILSSITNEKNEEAVDLNQVIQKVISNLQQLPDERNAIIEYPTLPVLLTDETHMLQLFQNIISNALKYNTREVPEVKIQCILTGKKYKFSIADNGIGIPEEFRKKVFLIFQRLHSRDEFSGTGIGLAICKKIIDQAGGSIWVEGNSAGGSTFIFTIPVK